MEIVMDQVTRIQLEASICRDSFYEFVRMAWPILYPSPENKFIDGKMIKLITSHLEACTDGRIRNIIINLPIRHSKSALCVILWPVWLWIRKPTMRILCSTYSEERAGEDAVLSRNLIQSDWFKMHFPYIKLAKDANQKTRFSNTRGGVRHSFGLDGPIQGGSYDVIICDDPQKPGELTDAVREHANKVYNESIWPRAVNLQTCVRVIIQQRLHLDDLTGNVLSGPNKSNWYHLCLPAVYDTQRYSSPLGKEFDDWRTEPGELLFPERFTQDALNELKAQLASPLAIAGQLQQLPSTEGGVIFKAEYFKNRIQFVDNYVYRFLSWDTANTDTGAYTSGLVGELLPDNRLVIVDCFHEQITFPDLVREVRDMANRYKHKLRAIVIETKSTGTPLMDTLKRGSDTAWLIPLIKGFDPTNKGKKAERARLAAVWCANGSVLLPEMNEINSKWLTPFEDEVFSFPQTKYMDIVDSFSQLILFSEKYLAKGFRARTKMGGI